MRRFLASEPHLVGVGVAGEVIPGMADDLLLHAGPPVAWDRASGPLRGAVIGGLLLEGKARTAAEAKEYGIIDDVIDSRDSVDNSGAISAVQ